MNLHQYARLDRQSALYYSSLDEISDPAWTALTPHLLEKAGDIGQTGIDNRLFLHAVLWVACHGCAWRTLPAQLGKHDTLRKRSWRWTQEGVRPRLFAAMPEPD
ncbi:MAG: transposase [Janthinobacterium lividum]